MDLSNTMLTLPDTSTFPIFLSIFLFSLFLLSISHSLYFSFLSHSLYFSFSPLCFIARCSIPFAISFLPHLICVPYNVCLISLSLSLSVLFLSVFHSFIASQSSCCPSLQSLTDLSFATSLDSYSFSPPGSTYCRFRLLYFLSLFMSVSVSSLPPASSWKCQAWNERTTAAVLFSLELCSVSLSISWSPPSSWGWEERERSYWRGKSYFMIRLTLVENWERERERSKRVSVREPTSHPSYPDSNLLFILFSLETRMTEKEASSFVEQCERINDLNRVLSSSFSHSFLSLLNFSLSLILSHSFLSPF